MQTVETKTSSGSVHLQRKTDQPFFNKKGQETFFSKSNEATPSFFTSALIQPKLTVGQPNDKYEKEADRMADKVVQRLAAPSIQRKCAHCEEEERKNKEGKGTIQRKCAECESASAKASADKEEKLQKKSNSSEMPKTSFHIEAQLNSSKGGGSPIPDAVKEQMESSFGTDFSGVRLHTDSGAVQMNKALSAQAFTHGSDIYFNTGKYDTSSKDGKHLIAHELTHVVQQGEGNIIRQQPLPAGIKEHGDITQIPDDVRGDCNIATVSSSSEQRVPYTHNSSHLTPESSAILNEFAKEWRRRGANATVRIDGYASTEGGEGLNWRLSCSRAKTVKSALLAPSDGTPGIPESFMEINAHGETNRFSQTTLDPNRLATITSTIPVSPNPPKPPLPKTPDEEKICGPDVSGEVARVWRQIQSDFNSWGFRQKESACRYLIQPIVPNPTTGRLEKNIDAFDTLGLFLNTAGWTQRPPYHPPCGVPGSSGNPCNNRDPGHEDPNRCSNTVKIGSGCWLTGTANYGTYGVMMKLCADWVNSPLAVLLLPIAIRQVLSQAFSYSTMVSLITAYKLYDRENPAWPLAWSSATYLGNPGSSPPGGNRPDCLPTCPVAFTTPSFDYVWEPTKPRGAISAIYNYPCTTSP